jgi:hypothetical protein
MFRYTLDKSSKKYICPNCQKKTFVKYFDNIENKYLEDSFGRCDRESNCKYHKSFKDNNFAINNFEPIRKSKSTINKIEVSKHGREFKNNNFIQFLKKHFTDADIKKAILKYLIGTSSHWNGATIFWQIDNREQVCTGKVMLYDINTGKRIKDPFPHINWMHKILNLKNFELQQCLFGLHLINEYDGETIAIVESEKTAIMMSMFMPDYLWIATGSKTNFKIELLEAIKKFKIIAFPDKSEFDDWSIKTEYLKKNGFNIKCSRLIEGKNVDKGFDLADYFLEKKNNICYTQTEIAIKKLAQKKPEILNLIKTFDLVDKYFNDIINIH